MEFRTVYHRLKGGRYRVNKIKINIDKEPDNKALFFLNSLPRKNTEYLILADGIIESKKVVLS